MDSPAQPCDTPQNCPAHLHCHLSSTTRLRERLGCGVLMRLRWCALYCVVWCVLVGVVCSVYELVVENLAVDPALADGDLLSSPSLSSSSARRLRFDLTSSLSFKVSTSQHLHLREDATAKRQQSGLLDVVFTWGDQFVQRMQRRFAFMLLDLPEATNGRRHSDTLRPLDIAYAARLCAYENAATLHRDRQHHHTVHTHHSTAAPPHRCVGPAVDGGKWGGLWCLCRLSV